MPIYQWSEISNNFSDGLLLGNGASMAIHRQFGYTGLFAAAQDHNHITPQVAAFLLRSVSTISNWSSVASGRRRL